MGDDPATESTATEVALEAVAAAPPEAVWRALVDHRVRGGWWPGTELDPAVGGRFTERWTGPGGEPKLTAGTVLDATPGRSLSLSWADTDWPADTTVTLDLVPVAAGTEVRLRHTGFGRLPDAARVTAEHRAGWRVHLADLCRAAEAGTGAGG
jgi:uncharacterized protein YndB with AHSA1/START domain